MRSSVTREASVALAGWIPEPVSGARSTATPAGSIGGGGTHQPPTRWSPPGATDGDPTRGVALMPDNECSHTIPPPPSIATTAGSVQVVDHNPDTDVVKLRITGADGSVVLVGTVDEVYGLVFQADRLLAGLRR